MSHTKSPVLLIGFNRPDTMQKVFNEVRRAQPLKLYYAVDCAREGKDDEAEKVNQVKDIINQVDWSCEVFTLFQKTNRGCGYGPSEAISWAFEKEDQLIVLEDDCVPSLSFFRFCDDMLERYKDDERVNIISGRSHHQGSLFFKEQDYVFTHYAHTWGWATWKRAWHEFDMKMSDFPSFIKGGGALNVFSSKREGVFFNKWFENIYSNIEKECTHSWDTQWLYARVKTGALGIVPAFNLIENIGTVGTHSAKPSESHYLGRYEMPDILKHPKFIIQNKSYESNHFKTKIVPPTCTLKIMISKLLRMLFPKLMN